MRDQGTHLEAPPEDCPVERIVSASSLCCAVASAALSKAPLSEGLIDGSAALFSFLYHFALRQSR
jgi:hypothetical protein